MRSSHSVRVISPEARNFCDLRAHLVAAAVGVPLLWVGVLKGDDANQLGLQCGMVLLPSRRFRRSSSSTTTPGAGCKDGGSETAMATAMATSVEESTVEEALAARRRRRLWGDGR